jgi:uncharacterized protein (DUF58 family)
VGRLVDAARVHFGRDTRGFLEGGRYALVHTRSLEFDDLRPYVPGDDVRDIDWKATARSGHTLIKRFVSEKHHKILVVADAGRNTAGLAPSGELKRDVAAHVIGALGLVTLRRSDQIGMVFGDARGCVDIALRRGETHIESMLHRFTHHTTEQPAASDVVAQLDWVARHHRHSLLIVVVSDEPDADERLGAVLRPLATQHDVMWAMVADMPAVASPDDDHAGWDVRDGRTVLSGVELGPAVVAAYRRAESARRQRLSAFMAAHGVPYAVIDGSSDIRRALAEMTEVFHRVG